MTQLQCAGEAGSPKGNPDPECVEHQPSLATAWESPAALSGVAAELVENGFAATTTNASGAIRVTQRPLMPTFVRDSRRRLT